MTVIAGYSDGVRFAISADSAVTEGDIWYLDGPKVWRKGDYLVGAAGGYKECVWASECPVGEPYALADYMKKKIGKKNSNFSILVVGLDGVWVIDCDYIPIPHERFWAIGSAAQAALGALIFAHQWTLYSPSEIVSRAVETSIAVHVVARGPAYVLSNEA